MGIGWEEDPLSWCTGRIAPRQGEVELFLEGENLGVELLIADRLLSKQ